MLIPLKAAYPKRRIGIATTASLKRDHSAHQLKNDMRKPEKINTDLIS